ncbi:transporter substrate-binding domain-containing protein [Vampirovibrio sp.]|uniref:transporter substrate-binding domain-containing protein n=1 Tax=Vampirovibrio sp. TaxID=2717857 RepID=UPI00359397B5
MPLYPRSKHWLLVPLMLGLLFGFGCAAKQTVSVDSVKARGKLLAGVKYDSPPFGYLDTSGQLHGYDIELLRDIGKRVLGSEQAVDFQQVFSSTRVIALNSGSLDVVAATMTITPERAKVVDFSDPYFVAHQAVMVPEGSPIQTLQDLNGKTILFVLGTTSEATIKKRLPQARYTGFKTSTDAFSALKAKRGDALTTDDAILYGFMGQHCGFRLLKETLSEEPYGLAFRQIKGQAPPNSLKNAVNRALADMKNDGTLTRLSTKWISPEQAKKSCKP